MLKEISRCTLIFCAYVLYLVCMVFVHGIRYGTHFQYIPGCWRTHTKRRQNGMFYSKAQSRSPPSNVQFVLSGSVERLGNSKECAAEKVERDAKAAVGGRGVPDRWL